MIKILEIMIYKIKIQAQKYIKLELKYNIIYDVQNKQTSDIT